MSAMFAQNPLGRIAPLAAFAAAGLVVLATAFLKERAPTHLVPSPVVETRLLVFSDAPQGAVRVNTPDGVAVATFGSGEGGFLRGVLRTFARERRGSAVGAEQPFELARHADGRVSLKDPANGQIVVLDAFGATNAAAFVSLFKAGKGEP
jgi:putative photosynthetic complex assembly protein